MTPHAKPGAGRSTTNQERRNLALAKKYMEIAYSPERASADAVKDLCAANNKFTAPTTFPHIHTLEAYAEEHGKLMREIADLHIVQYDVAFARGDWVCLRYTAEGSHCGAPHDSLDATHQHARWSASALFRVQDGKLVEFIKDWNKLAMWQQLGWPVEECSSEPDLAAVAEDPQRSMNASVV